MRWRRPQRPAQLPAGFLAPASGSRPPVGPAPSPWPGQPESCPCHHATAARVQKGTILSRLPALPGGGGIFFAFRSGCQRGEPVGHLPSHASERLRGGGRDQPLGARRILAPEAAEAGAASSLGIGAGVSAPREEPPQPRRSRAEEVTAPLPGFYFFSLRLPVSSSGSDHGAVPLAPLPPSPVRLAAGRDHGYLSAGFWFPRK